MELRDFIQKFADLFENVDASQISEHTKFKDLEEWSSLIALFTIAMVKDEYDVILQPEDIRNSNTIRELFAIINNVHE